MSHIMDISQPRTHFVARNFLYACSFDCKVSFWWTHSLGKPGTSIPIKTDVTEKEGAVRLYHVLDANSVDGVDGRRHLVPTGRLAKHTVDRFELDSDGRSVVVTGCFSNPTQDLPTKSDLPDDLTITYRGVVNLHGYFRSMVDAVPFIAKAQLVLAFATQDTRFRWLVEHGTVAFSTWTFHREAKYPDFVFMNVTGDVYSAG
jgi:hypothetical protein